ncbi:MAG: hypothetical protein K0S25_1424 [Bacillus sp. (in: firmicutes)]|nr:hypothetical protein [Bacillus sp. (in: firmicutes)]
MAMKVIALLATTTLALAPINTSASLLGGGLTSELTGTVSQVTGAVSGTVGAVSGVVSSAVTNPVGTVASAVTNPVGTVTSVTQPAVQAVGGVVSGVTSTVGSVVPGGLPVSVQPDGTGVKVTTPVGNVGVLNPGVSVTTPVGNVEVLNPGVKVEILPNGTGGQAGTSGLVNATVISNQKLTGSPSKLDSKSKKITLNYSADATLNLDVLGDLKVVFKMPEEFKDLLNDPNFKKSLTASFNAPGLTVLGIPVLESKGTFSAKEIHVDTATNSVYINYKDLLSVAVLSPTAFNFKLEIALDKLPCAADNEYTFNAYTSNAFIDISVLESQAASLHVPVEFVKGACPGGNGTGDNGNNGGGSNDGNGSSGGNSNQPGKSGGNLDTKSDSVIGGLGNILPITGTNLGNIALVGLLTLLLGLAIKYIGFKKMTN